MRKMNIMSTPLDQTDRAILQEFRRSPRATLTEVAAAVGIARGTAYSRLDRLTESGVITGFGPDINPIAAGYSVTAFCTLEISQGTHDDTIGALAQIPEVLEIFTVTGAGDLLCRLVAQSNDDLHLIIQAVAAIRSVQRSQTQLALHTSHRRHFSDLL